MRCPVILKNGEQCTGEIVGATQRWKAWVRWTRDDGEWKEKESELEQPTSHIHLLCDRADHNEKEGDILKVWELPE